MPRSDQLDSGNAITVRLFKRGNETAFRVLNEEWIERYFELEAKDRSSFTDPQSSIIERGGQILIATSGGRSVGWR